MSNETMILLDFPSFFQTLLKSMLTMDLLLITFKMRFWQDEDAIPESFILPHTFNVRLSVCRQKPHLSVSQCNEVIQSPILKISCFYF